MDESASTQGRRTRGRAGRIAMRNAEIKQHQPAAPGQSGGQYRPLSDEDVTAILDTAYRILEEIGMAEVPPVVMEQALAQGCTKNNLGRLSFSRSFVEDIIAGASKKFVLHGRDPSLDIEVGGEKVHFGTGGAGVQTLDLDSGLYRSSTLKDLYDFTRLADTLENVSWFTRCCVATDMTDNYDLDINTAYALIRGTKKPVGTSFMLGEYVDPVIEMFDIAMGGEGKI